MCLHREIPVIEDVVLPATLCQYTAAFNIADTKVACSQRWAASPVAPAGTRQAAWPAALMSYDNGQCKVSVAMASARWAVLARCGNDQRGVGCGTMSTRRTQVEDTDAIKLQDAYEVRKQILLQLLTYTWNQNCEKLCRFLN